VLGGGRGTRLYPLTKRRAKPAVPLGSMYRLIDIPISNCINSGIDRIFVLSQYMSAIGQDVVIRSHKGEPDRQEELYTIRDGIVVIPKNTIIPNGLNL
jgi:glucose-1-phosphate adenylyltransferase